MGKKLNPSFVEYFAGYLKKLLTVKTNGGTITAKDFQDAVTNAANVYLRDNYGIDAGGVRTAIAQSAPENECTKAIKARDYYNIGQDNRITFYKNQAQISNETKSDPERAELQLDNAKLKHKTANTNLHNLIVDDWTSKTNMLMPDPGQGWKKRQMAVDFDPTSAVYCGECWICKTDVMSYSGKSKNWYDDDDRQVADDTKGADQIDGTTPCGDCEHVSAIMASYIAGMLTSGGFAEVYWASYYVACVDCNRRKSNYIGASLNVTRGWKVDADGVNAIVDAIFPEGGVDQHLSEYNPIRHALTKKYNNMTPDEKFVFRKFVRENIEAGTGTWCEAANTKMGNMTEKTKHIKMSFNVSKIIVAITGHLNVITDALDKKAKSKAVKAALPAASKRKKTGGGDSDDHDDDAPMEGDAAPVTGEGDSDSERMDHVEAAPMTGEAAPMLGEGAAALTGEGAAALTGEGESDTERDDYGANNAQFDLMHTKTVEGVAPMPAAADTHDTDYTLRWYNFFGEPIIDDEYEYDCDEEDDAEFNARILNYRNVIAEYIGKKYGQILFTQCEHDADTFDWLITNLSNSMHETLKALDPERESLSDKTLKARVVDFNRSRNTAAVGPTVFSAFTGSPTGSALFTPKKPPVQTALPRIVTGEKPKPGTGFSSIAAKYDPEFTIGSESRTGSTPLVEEGGSRLNKRHSKNNSQTHKQKNRTKRVSYIKHKQTRKNQYSRKTK